jgi:hypothetical protein
MTKQDYYNLLVQSACDGTFPSYDPVQRLCCYRGPGKKRCAVGLLIPDDKYAVVRKTEGCSIERLLKDCGPQVLDWPDDMTEQDLNEVQNCHDTLASPFYRPLGWDARSFVRRLNALECFQDVSQRELGPVPETI